MNVKLNAPRSCGSTCIAAASTGRSGEAAMSAVTRSESVVAAKAPGTPASAALLASSAVFTRLPLWHSAIPVPASVSARHPPTLPASGPAARLRAGTVTGATPPVPPTAQDARRDPHRLLHGDHPRRLRGRRGADAGLAALPRGRRRRADGVHGVH